MTGLVERPRLAALTCRSRPCLSRTGLGLAALFLLATVIVPAGAGEIDDPVAGIAAVSDEDFRDNDLFPVAKVRLGQFLFFDKILSGNRNIACATCHHPKFATADGLALALGEGAEGLGPARRVVAANPVIDREPRNSQALFNLGAKEFRRMFHDGRVAADPERYWRSGFRSPALDVLPSGLDNVLAAQAMFPVTSEVEMAGHEGENPIATAAAARTLSRFDRVWTLLARRLQEIPEYVALFKGAFAEIDSAQQITFKHAANAIAAFEASSFRADDSPFDRYLRTRDPAVVGEPAFRGMALFYGKAGCAGCHSGKFLTDQQFHAIAMPQIGPGKDHGVDNSYWRATGFLVRLEDRGRFGFTRRVGDKYRFRTPSLRNVELTGPWGHAGSYDSLEAVVRHHLDPVRSLNLYDPGAAKLPSIQHAIDRWSFEPIEPARLDAYLERDGWVQRAPLLRQAIGGANELASQQLTDAEIANLTAFLKSLTDPRSRDLTDLIPDRVPSGLPIDD